MPTLSLALIVKNESDTLGHCLASVQGLADQVVVVDTGSQDGTSDLARTLGAEVHGFNWCDDFAAARNASLSHCTSDWILILDADEAVDARDHAVIRGALEAPEVHAYRLVLRNYYRSGSQSLFGQPVVANPGGYAEGATFPYCADFHGLRLARRHTGLAFHGRIHELLDPWFETRNLPVRPLNAVIHHYGKTFDDRENQKKVWYLELARSEARAKPGELQAQFNLMQQAMAAAHWQETLDAALACLAHKSLAPALMAAGLALQELERPAEALPYLEKLLAHQPAHSLARNRRALSLALTGRVEAARRAWEDLQRDDPTFTLAHLNAAEFELMAGNIPEARRLLENGIAACPSEAGLWDRRLQVAVQTEGLAASALLAKRALQQIPGGGRGLWQRLAALQAAQEGRRAESLDWIAQGLARHPGDPDLEGLRARLG